jgi:uncharacterized membrane protein (UPF0127 family)
MAWLVHEGTVLASLERADSFRRRTVGLIGRSDFDGALLLEKTRSVHTFGMKFPIDVAFCDKDLQVIRVLTMDQRRVSKLHLQAWCAIETEAGRFRHWQVGPGAQLEIRGELSADTE